MNDDSLQTSFWVMVIVQTVGSVDMPGKGARKMPSPRQYVAIVATWLVLMVVSEIGEGARRAVTALGWLLVLAGMVIGPFGQRTISLINTVASNFSSSGIAATEAAQEGFGGFPGTGTAQPSTLSPTPPPGVTLK